MKHPAYDICPQPRPGGETTQAVLIIDNNRFSQIKTCIEAAHQFKLSKKDALDIAKAQIRMIEE